MLFQRISADGVVDLKSPILSGTIKASTAALLMCFFALFIIVFVLATLLTPASGPTSGAKPHARRLMPLFWGILLTMVLCAVGAALTENAGGRLGFTMTLGFLGIPLITVVMALV